MRTSVSALLGISLLTGLLQSPLTAFAKSKYQFEETPSFFDDFSAGWEQSQKDWRVATWKQNGTQMSPERCKTDGNGLMIQTVLKGVPKSGGSMQTGREYPYGRWVARVKPSSVRGVLNSIFTKDWDDLKTPEPDNDGRGGEVDIEFLTYTFGRKTGQVHLAIHTKDRPNYFERNTPLSFNPSDDFHEWGFDILPDRVIWHVDGKVLEEFRYPSKGFIEPDYEFFFNSWTQGKWINGPAPEDAHYQIDWVKFFPLKESAQPE